MDISAAFTSTHPELNPVKVQPRAFPPSRSPLHANLEGVFIIEVTQRQAFRDPHFKVLMMDETCQALLGVSQFKGSGQQPKDCLPANLAQPLQTYLVRCWREQVSQNFHLWLSANTASTPVSVNLRLTQPDHPRRATAQIIGVCQIPMDALATLPPILDQTWQSLIDTLPGIAFRAVNSTPRSITYLSEGCHSLIGYSSHELLSPAAPITYDELIYPSDLSLVLGAIDQAIAHRQSYAVEYRVLNRHQQELWFLEQGHVVVDSAHQVLGVQGFISDITASKQVQTSLLESTSLLQVQQDLLRDIDTHYQRVFENAVSGIFQITRTGQYLKANLALAQMYGYPCADDLIAERTDGHYQAYVDPQSQINFMAQMQQYGRVRNLESAVFRKDGAVIWISESAWIVPDQMGQPWYYEGTVEEITERKVAELTLQRHDELLQGVAEAMNFLLTVPHYDSAVNHGLATLGQATGVDRVYIYENNPHPESNQVSMTMRYEWTRSGIPASVTQVYWQNLDQASTGLITWYHRLCSRQIVKGLTRLMSPQEQQILNGDQTKSILMVPILVDGYFWGYIGFDDCRHERQWSKTEESILQAMACSFGSTLKRQIVEATMRYQAFYDPLTRLPNRLLLTDRLQLALLNAQRNAHCAGVLLLDLDRFKGINDTLGHAAGDRLLQMVSDRLQSCLCQGDTLARWGGDEFTLLLPQVKTAEELALIAQRVLDHLKPVFHLGSHQLHLSATIGIALYPQDGTDAETLLCQADVALYRAKERGRNHYQFYVPHMSSTAAERLNLENQLYHALEREELLLYYQPQVNLQTWQITGMEALLRWQHPTLGLVLPGTFIPIAEDNGLIFPFGEWALKTACRQNKRWQEMGLEPIRISVNISARQFQDANLVVTIANVLQETDLDPRWLELEITETTVMQNIDFAQNMLQELAHMGVHLAIDDFGTGYSSLGYLKQFPLHSLKIDRTFVHDLEPSSPDAAITSAVIALGHGLNLKVIAEGVETPEQLEVLRSLQCTELQGYLFSCPVPAPEATRLLTTQELSPSPDVSAQEHPSYEDGYTAFQAA